MKDRFEQVDRNGKNYRWIYTYDYAPGAIWEPWRESEDVSGWISEEADRVADRIHENASSFVLLADSHFSYNGTWEDTRTAMKLLADRIRLSGIIHLGDLTDGWLPLEQTLAIEERCISDMKSIGVPLFLVPGNHDYNYFRNNPDIKYPAVPQYYIDDPKQKLRMIFIDSFDPMEPYRYGFTEYCVHWLDACLRQTPGDFAAIIFSHVTPLVRLQAWTDNVRNREKLIPVLDKYADRILAFINGHNHCDHLFNDLHNGLFPIVSINCAKCEYFTEHKPEGAVVPFRRLGDRTQESFDVMQVDVSGREIYFTRFGAGSDRVVMDHKAFYCE